MSESLEIMIRHISYVNSKHFQTKENAVTGEILRRTREDTSTTIIYLRPNILIDLRYLFQNKLSIFEKLKIRNFIVIEM